MSYCRWSSDNFNCDLYCYEDVSGGWTTHVADNRRKPGTISTDRSNFEPIGLPYDGKTFNDPTIEDFRDRLTMLRDAGYQFPDYVIETVDEIIAEEAEKAT